MKIGFLAAAATVGAGCLTAAPSVQDPMVQQIQEKVIQIIDNAEKIPGLDSTVFQSLKPEISASWKKLVLEGVLEVQGSDCDVRPTFVALQAIFESVLSYELGSSVKSLVGVIHTPMPATPLCTKGSISPTLVSSEVEQDPRRLFTVQARSTIIRDYLEKGGGALYCIS
jgi:hypothetical protein